MRILLNTTLAAASKGCFYNSNINGTASDNPFDCREHRVPNY